MAIIIAWLSISSALRPSGYPLPSQRSWWDSAACLDVYKRQGLKADAFALENAEDITGVNDQQQLAEAAKIIDERKKTHS